MAIELAATALNYGLASYAIGFISKRISNHFQNQHQRFEMEHQEKKLQIRADAKNRELVFADREDARKHTFKFARRAIVLSIFWLSVILIFLSAYLKIQIVIPVDVTKSILWGLFKIHTTVLKHADGLFFDYKTMGNLATSVVFLYMGQASSKG